MTVNIYQVKTRLSYYVSLAQKGKRVIISKRNIPVAEIAPLTSIISKRLIGQAREKFEVPDAFFKPLPQDIIDSFNNPK